MNLTPESRINALIAGLDRIDSFEIFGRVAGIRGLLIEIVGPLELMEIGGRVRIETGAGKFVMAEIIGVTPEYALAMPFGNVDGLRRGMRALVTDRPSGVFPDHSWLGRVLNGLGEPIDSGGALGAGANFMPFRADPPPAHSRRRLGPPFQMGVRVLDSFLTCCKGQRMGIFAGSGVGKSVLLSMLARNAASDVAVIGLIGERGREVQEFLQEDLGAAGLARSVVIVATSDEPALMRRQAAYLMLSVAEYFRDQGLNVLCIDGQRYPLCDGAT